MEEAQRKLFEVAAKGCITSVNQLMIDDPSIREDLKLLVKALSSDVSESKERKKKSLEETIKECLEKKKNSLMVVASLLATMCFQIGVSPLGGVWQEGNDHLLDLHGSMVNSSGNPSSYAVDKDKKNVTFSLYAWIGLTVLIVIAHVIRLVVKLVKTLFRALLKLLKLPRKYCSKAACSPV